MGIFMAVAVLAFACALYCYWSDLEAAIVVIDAGFDFTNDTYRLVFAPIWHQTL